MEGEARGMLSYNQWSNGLDPNLDSLNQIYVVGEGAVDENCLIPGQEHIGPEHPRLALTFLLSVSSLRLRAAFPGNTDAIAHSDHGSEAEEKPLACMFHGSDKWILFPAFFQLPARMQPASRGRELTSTEHLYPLQALAQGPSCIWFQFIFTIPRA